MQIKKIVKSDDEKSIKYIQETFDGFEIETLYVEKEEKHIICVSSQVGCKIGCYICNNGLNANFIRNLDQEELVKESLNVIEQMGLENSKKPILFSYMGIGEPVLNLDNVVASMKYLNKMNLETKFSFATTGIKPEVFLNLADKIKDLQHFKLAISLHGATNEVREKIIPLKIDLKKMVKSVKEYQQQSKSEVEWYYLLIKDVNDSLEDAANLVSLLGAGSKIKMYNLNPVENAIYEESDDKTREEFVAYIKEKGLACEEYQLDGVDIFGSCGQMITRKN